MAAKRELILATAFFALLGVFVVAFLRPLDAVGWACFAISIAFVVLGCFALSRKEGASVPRGPGLRTIHSPPIAATATAAQETLLSEAQAGAPTPGERALLETTLEALVEADVLAPGEVDAGLLWRAAQHVDPGQPVDRLDALHALAVLQEFGLFAPRRLVFVPSHTEYDAALLAEITASGMTALGHGIGRDDVSVVLPADGAQGRAAITFPLDGRRETIGCEFLWKYPPADLFDALARFRRADDPRELVGADVDHGMLLIAAIRPGRLDALNRRFPGDYPVFGPP